MKKRSVSKDLSKLHYLFLFLCLVIIVVLLVKIFALSVNNGLSSFYEIESKDKNTHGYLVQSIYRGSMNIDKIEFENDICEFHYQIFINEKEVSQKSIYDDKCQMTNEYLKRELEIIPIYGTKAKKVKKIELVYEYNKKNDEKNTKKEEELFLKEI
ncbi:MAG: hypothetical protein K2G03_00195 [Bacilli bacterium]|nr:hypothetical protein [Bacilli bacterium]